MDPGTFGGLGPNWRAETVHRTHFSSFVNQNIDLLPHSVFIRESVPSRFAISAVFSTVFGKKADFGVPKTGFFPPESVFSRSGPVFGENIVFPAARNGLADMRDVLSSEPAGSGRQRGVGAAFRSC